MSTINVLEVSSQNSSFNTPYLLSQDPLAASSHWSHAEMEDTASLCGDGWFGPVVASQGCRGGFDFTLFFESTILAVTPAACFILLAPFRVYQLSKQTSKVISSINRLANLVSVSTMDT